MRPDDRSRAWIVVVLLLFHGDQFRQQGSDRDRRCPDYGVALPSAIYVISNTVVGEITPAARRGALLVVGTAVANSAGLLAPYIMWSVVESATIPLDGIQHRFFMCGVIMLVGGAIAMALVNPERDGTLDEVARGAGTKR